MNDAYELTLYSYWRSSAAYRVRIALNLKTLPYRIVPVNLLAEGGEQHRAPFRELNPQRLVPVLVHGERVFRQSLAIIEYLDGVFPDPPLLPRSPRERARVQGLAQVIACDVHPIANLRVLRYLEREFGADEEQRAKWCRHWIVEGLSAMEALLESSPSTGTFCEGEEPTLADCCLVPQLYNARRYGIDPARFPTLARIEAACLELPAFRDAAPERQPDAPA
ncbi:MAG: maleylacetoacetate isomerase [Xanthomonadales bacterium]|nr:maleylacetoacetate isomerase [Xanthomonadales bacterium]